MYMLLYEDLHGNIVRFFILLVTKMMYYYMNLHMANHFDCIHHTSVRKHLTFLCNGHEYSLNNLQDEMTIKVYVTVK